MRFAVIPCYNTANSLPRFLSELSAFIPPEKIICINDGSFDKTATSLAKSGVRVLHHAKNQGKGSCFKTGFTHALKLGATEILTMDSDGQHTCTDIPKFLNSISSHDLVIGSRQNSFSFLKSPTMPFGRKVSNRTTSFILSRILHQPISDSQCGFRLINRQCAEFILPLCKENGFMFETEFLIHSVEKKFKVDFVPIQTIYGNEQSHIRYLIETINFIKLAIQHL